VTRDCDTGNCLSRSTPESVCDSSGAGDGKSLKYGSVVDPRIGCYSLRLICIVMQITSYATPTQSHDRTPEGRVRLPSRLGAVARRASDPS